MIGGFADHMLFVKPVAEVDELAAFTAEGAMAVFPIGAAGLSALGATANARLDAGHAAPAISCSR